MLTNWPTIETRLHKFRDLRPEQKTGGTQPTKVNKNKCFLTHFLGLVTNRPTHALGCANWFN
ncbi:hypothetical protein Gohar_026714 [Gossypium harknessii]|uniref:Uncharacterized protein n=1 Tax=Gossypium harknessii TaxID=34285 RepID=A0A7J9HSH7_9ROSI|nr:hypothetical protein [Gossypium harknessii]